MGAKKNKKQSELIIEELIKRSEACHKLVRTLMLSERIDYPELSQALKHYFSYWNDFTHPGIFSIACEAVGTDPASQIEAQAAVSMLGAAFDIHDDIIDSSKVKHQHPTVFGKYGQNVGLLLGNAFIIYGFTLMGKATNNLPAQKKNRIFTILRRSLFDVGNAHASELGLRRKLDASPDEYLKIIEKKAASIEADMNVAAILGGGTTKECSALARFGRIMGTLATLREEFIDVFDAEELNQRINAEALPIPLLYAFQDKDSRKKIEKLLASKKLNTQQIEDLLDTVMDSRPVANLKTRMSNLITQAQNTLHVLQNERTRKLLADMAEATLEDL